MEASLSRPLLVVDPSSPTATLALGEPGTPGRCRELPQKQTSERLLATIDDMLTEQSLSLSALAGVVAVRGPGSFTGLRIGLATLYGLHQASGVPTTAISTLRALACAATEDGVVLAIVDALRGEWFAQSFLSTKGGAPTASDPLVEPQILTEGELEALAATPCAIDTWVGHSHPEIQTTQRFVEPPHLASAVLQRIANEEFEWDPSSCLRPLYLRAPAVTLPRARRPESIG